MARDRADQGARRDPAPAGARPRQPADHQRLAGRDRGDRPAVHARGWRRRRWPRCGRCRPRRGTRRADDPLSQAMQMLDDAGFTSVLGTNCDQTYERYLRVGEQVSVTTRLEAVVGPEADRRRGGLLRHHPQRLARRRRGGRHDAVPGAQVQAARVGRRDSVARPVEDHPAGAQPRHRLLLGGHPAAASCASRSATPAASCGTRPGRSARRATRWTAATSSRAAAARSSASSCTTPRRCPGKRAAVDDRARRARGRGADGRPTYAATRRTSRSATPCRWRWDRIDDELTLPIWEAGPVNAPTATGTSLCPRGSCRSRRRWSSRRRSRRATTRTCTTTATSRRATGPRTSSSTSSPRRGWCRVRRGLGSRGGRARVRRTLLRAPAGRPGPPRRHADASPATVTDDTDGVLTHRRGRAGGLDRPDRRTGPRRPPRWRSSDEPSAARPRSPGSVRPSSPRSPAAPSSSSRPRRPWRRSPTRG